MKIRRSVTWFVTICAIAILLLAWLANRRRKTMSENVGQIDGVPAAHRERSLSKTSPNKADTSVRTNTDTEPSMPTPPPFAQSKSHEIREGLAALNDVPIVFFGKLEDQFGNPVAGAQV